MFQYNWETRTIIDDTDEAELRVISSHPHATEGLVGIFDRDGNHKFTAKFRSYSIDVRKELQVIDPPGQRALLSARACDEHGRWHDVEGSHPDLDRMIEFYRVSSESKINVDRFVLVDLRTKGSI